MAPSTSPSSTPSGSAPRPSLGLAFVPTIPPEELVPLARAVEAAGLDELWVWEDCFKQSGIASAAVALASTERIAVGIGLLPAPLRNVALTAMELATLARQFPDRLIAGVGHGVQSWMGQVGARVSSPLRLLEEYTDALRRLLAGETVTVQGRYVCLDDVTLDWPPHPAPPLMVGGAGPKSIRLAARIGDGNLLVGGLGSDQIAAVVETVRAERPDAGANHPVVAPLIVAAGHDAEARLAADLENWRADVPSAMGAAGSARDIADAVRVLAAAGATSVTFQPTLGEPDVLGLARFLGSEVAPLLP